MHYINTKYVEEALKSFLHPISIRPHQAPHLWVKPTYGQKIQLTEEVDKSDPPDDKTINQIQKIMGELYYYARVVDHTMLATRRTKGMATKKLAVDV